MYEQSISLLLEFFFLIKMFKSQICKTILSARDMTVFMPSCHLLTLYVYLGEEGMELDGTHVNKHMNKP